jgi:hypothetical protein
MICETVHNFAAMPASLLAVSFAIGWQHTLTTPCRWLARIDPPKGDDLPIVAQVRF